MSFLKNEYLYKMRVCNYFLPVCFAFLFICAAHPFYLGVTNLKYKHADELMECTTKLFTNDLEDALKKTYNTKVDLINGSDTSSNRIIVSDYFKKHFKLKINGKQLPVHFLGFEHESEAVWIYAETKNCVKPSGIEVNISFLYEHLASQTHIVNVNVSGIEKSSKVTNPSKQLAFDF